MANFPIKQFLGLRQTADPEIGTALIASNLKRNVTRGRLENMDGAASLLSLPSPAGNLGYTNLSFKKPFSFYVADAGGSNIYAVSSTYTKASHGFVSTATNTAGVWINQYHDGSNWVSGWRELTEYYVFRYAGSAANVDGETMNIPLSTGGGVADPSVLASIIGEGWVVVRNGDHTATTNTGFKVVSLTTNTLKVVGQTGDLTGWSGGSTVFYVYRSNIGALLPSAITTQFRGVLDEVRVNTGNTASDSDVALFYRDKTFFQGISLARKGTYAEYGQLKVPSPTFKLRNPGITSSTTLGLEAGVYTLRQSMLMDDGQETELRDGLVGSYADSLMPGVTGPVGSAQQRYGVVNDGTSIFVLGGTTPNGYGYSSIIKYDADTLTPSATYNLDAGWVGTRIGIKGGVLYVSQWNTNTWRLQAFDTNLQLTGTGATYTPGVTNTPSSGVLTGNSFYVTAVNGTTNYIYKFSLTTLAQTNARTMTATTGNGMVAIGESAEGDFWVADGSSQTPARLFYFPAALTSETSVSLGGTSAWSYGGIVIGAYIYAANTNGSIYRVNTSTKSAASWKSGLSAAQYGFATDSSNLFVCDSTNLRAIRLSDAVTLASYTMPVNGWEMTYFSNRLCVGSFDDLALRMFSWFPTSVSFTSQGSTYPTFDLAVSPGFVPRRASAIRVYINKDGGPFYLAKTYSILSGGETFSGTSVFDSTVQHRYYVSTGKSITQADYSAATVTATAQLGRLSTDTGINRYLYAITANLKTYAIGMLIGGRVLRNKVFISAVSGDGVAQYDVLPNDVTTVLDVEFNDGDYSIALGNVADRILVLKSKSLVLLTPDAAGGHTRDVVATGVGISAADTLCAFNEALYWLDSTGIWEFTTRGLRNMSESITPTVFGWTDNQRAAAFAVIDPKYLLYRLYVNGVWYVLDLKDGEWTTETWPTLLPAFAARDIGSRRYMWLSGTTLYNPLEKKMFSGSGYTLSWQSNKIELPLERGYDGLLAAFYCDYSSPVNLTLAVYLDDYSAATRTYTLPLAGMGVVVPAPLACRCKSFKLVISAVLTADDQNVQIRRLGAYFNQIPVGGDRHVVQEPGT